MEANLDNVKQPKTARPWPTLPGGALPVKGMNGDDVKLSQRKGKDSNSPWPNQTAGPALPLKDMNGDIVNEQEPAEPKKKAAAPAPAPKKAAASKASKC